MMKKGLINKLQAVLLLLAFLLGLPSCSDTDYETVAGRVAVTFIPQIGSEAPHPSSLPPRSPVSGSRAVDQSWTEGDQVGVCMVKADAALPTGSVFSRYEISGSASYRTLSPVTVSQKLFFPDDDSGVNFVAFSPYATVVDNMVTYSGFASQSAQADMEKVDFLYYKGTTSHNKSDGWATLTFGHKLSKVVINVTTTTDADAVTLSSLGMTITGTPGSVSANLADGTLTAGNAATITPYHTSGETNTRVATAILVPHTARSGRTITFTTTEGSFTCALPTELAFESGAAYTLNFIMTRQGVVMSDATTHLWEEGSMNWEEGYALEAPKETMLFAQTGNGTSSFTFRSNYKGTLNVVLSTDATDATAGVPSWITAGELTTTPGSYYTAYGYGFTVEDNAGTERTAYVHIVNDENKSLAVVELEQDGWEPVSNAYIVAPGGNTIYIPVSRANEHAEGAIGANDTFTAEVLWSDVQGLIATIKPYERGATGAVEVTTTATTSVAGNALIAVKVNDVIKWSWHIWVTDYVPTPIGDLGWMDRNLGATANAGTADLAERYKTFGLLYQWGRKDPFPSSGPQTVATTAVEPTLYNGAGTAFTYAMNESEVSALGAATLISTQQAYDWSIANPLTFIGFSGSWFNDPKPTTTNNQWGYTGGKSIYDPCPPGYRVPVSGSWGTAGDWTAFTWNTTYLGRDTGTAYGGWYPAAGRRANATGALSFVGTYGYAWSATPSSAAYGNYLYFTSGGVTPAGSSNRTCGYGVRCLLEQ